MAWFRKAAEQGNAKAQLLLGLKYAEGEGVPEDYVKGYAWYNLAAAQGDETAHILKDSLREKMTADQVAEAQTLSRELYIRIDSSQSE